MSFATLQKRVFIPYCASCHGSAGGVSVESYSAVKQNLGRIERAALISGSMPKGGSLPQTETDLLRRWIAAGAPENYSDQPSTDPLKPNFASIKSKIFEPRCISCHRTGGPASGVPLAVLSDLLNSPREIVLPGNPDESGLVLALERNDSRRMPPTGTGSSALSSAEIATIRRWISLGAPEGETTQLRPVSSQYLSFAYIRARVLEPRCLSCHGAGSERPLSTYAETKPWIVAIERLALVTRAMPPSDSLSADETDALAAWLQAGAPENAGDARENEPPKPPGNTADVSYSEVRDRVLTPRCLTCHSGSSGLNLTTYESVNRALGAISVRVLFEKSMPPSGPLPEDELNLMARWIRAGAPENSVPAPSPSASPSPVPSLEPKFSSIRDRIFIPRCIACHDAGGSARGVPLKNWKELTNSPRELVIPGNSEESGLILALIRTDSRRMPPPESGLPPLNSEEIAIIRQWIQDGGKDN